MSVHHSSGVQSVADSAVQPEDAVQTPGLWSVLIKASWQSGCLRLHPPSPPHDTCYALQTPQIKPMPLGRWDGLANLFAVQGLGAGVPKLRY